jgi:hypothetical protein
MNEFEQKVLMEMLAATCKKCQVRMMEILMEMAGSRVQPWHLLPITE